MSEIGRFLASMPYAGSKKYKHLGPVMAVITWGMVVMAEARCEMPDGEVKSRSELVRIAYVFITSKGVAIPKDSDTATFLRKTCGTLFWRLVSLRFSPARHADAAAYATLLLHQAEEGFRQLLIEQIAGLPRSPEFENHRSIRHQLYNVSKALASDEAKAASRGYEPDTRQLRSLILVGRELFK